MKMNELISEIEDDLYYMDVATYDIEIADTYNDYVMLTDLKKRVADTSDIWTWFSSVEQVMKRVYDDYSKDFMYNLYCVLTFFPAEKHKKTQELIQSCTYTFCELVEAMMQEYKVQHLQVIEEVEGPEEYQHIIDLLGEVHRNQQQATK